MIIDFTLIMLLLSGTAGGLLRGVVGFIKHQFAYKNVQFKKDYIATIMVLSGMVGMLVTWTFATSGLQIAEIPSLNPAIAFIVGYAGGDFIENIYKILVGKTTLYPLPKK